jgi:diaminopimelate decarboxylase
MLDRLDRIGGVPVEVIITLAGTPAYVYDSAVMARQVGRMKTAFDGVPLRIMYACKALTNINVLRLMRRYGTGLDTVSIEEVELGLRAGFRPEEILFTPNMVGFQEYRRAVALGVHINIDSISVLEHFGHDYGGKVPVCIRVNPHIMAGGNDRISTGHIDSKFGISIHQLRHVERIVASHRMHVNGLHMHTGSDILDANAFLLAADILMNTAANFKYLEYIDFGSGFKVPYKDDDIETDIEEVGERISERFNQFCEEYGKPLTLVFEPGKFLVSQAGYFFVRATVVKPTPSTVFVGVDSGLNHLIRPMMYGSYHRIENISYPQGKPRFYTVVGNICETDTFGSNRKIASVEEGDVLCLFNAGAYGFSMASNYNSRFRPAEVMIHEGKDHLIRRRETMQDILRNQVEVQMEETAQAAEAV